MRALLRQAERTLAVAGVAIVALLATGLVLDVADFDRTRGGYSAPYADWTGQPIDWSVTDITREGMARRGYVTTLMVNCTSGLIEIEVWRRRFAFRHLSERAIVVHRPREACSARGFAPRF